MYKYDWFLANTKMIELIKMIKSETYLFQIQKQETDEGRMSAQWEILFVIVSGHILEKIQE